ncbi:NADPH oxidase [Lentinula raphanica]|uniref:NADPH oxidase n=1 Tax=Lentinula raphanica TaxID=153919 RepID=A0AA38PIM6_9AGAR|nr:NADPH oxidase [Lentinula raphanica]KAJ3762992.1 NADPH oxidase [Lentinula raphanica]KAJ3817801.1 NADPH oxidase [Lentinula raphanica]KAJ3843373.1 NADPH oxidase [Lentinula raphanica]KAJ3977690.1 NADPH oxidase [Lentinula raphanica]
MDFMDTRNPNPNFAGHNLEDHPDLKPAGGAHLQRNKTERVRLQGLQRANTTGSLKAPIEKGSLSFIERWKLWMINEGGNRMFFSVFILLHLLVGALGFTHYTLKDNLVNSRKALGAGFTIARASALLCHVDVIFILLPICRNFISFMRRTPLGTVIPFDKNITFHKAVGWSICIWSMVHTLAHIVNVVNLAIQSANTTKQRVINFLLICVEAGPAITGWIMWAALGTMAWYAREEKRRQNFERFWYTHHLFIVFFINWQLHGMFCMIKPDRPPYCSYNTIGVFWRYWIVGGVIWVFERILREVRSRHRTYISKVIQHPSNVMELQIKKEKTTTRAGQYIFINCPEISYFQWHPFTLTSAPEEDYISVHIRIVGDFTTALSKAVGCDFKSKEKTEAGGKVIGTDVNPPLNVTLPRVMVDGPFGSASEDFLNYEVVLLVGAGIGVTPFASILKSIWYRMNNFNHGKPTRLSKVYFTWVIRDFGSAEWFHSLLHAIEEQDVQNRIEINIYLTAKIKDDDMNNIIVQDVGAEKDAITSLRAPTHFGRPNWDKVFPSIASKHPDTDVGVFFCGPKVLSQALHRASNKYSDPNGARFFFGKENF